MRPEYIIFLVTKGWKNIYFLAKKTGKTTFFAQKGWKIVFCFLWSSCETSKATTVSEFFTVSRWTITFRLIRIFVPCGRNIYSLTEWFKSSRYHGWVIPTGAVRFRRGTHSSLTFRSTTEITLKAGNAYGRPMLQFCIIVSIP